MNVVVPNFRILARSRIRKATILNHVRPLGEYLVPIVITHMYGKVPIGTSKLHIIHGKVPIVIQKLHKH